MPCVLCEAAPHEPCETWTQVLVEIEPSGDNAVIDVCLEHYEAIEDAIEGES